MKLAIFSVPRVDTIDRTSTIELSCCSFVHILHTSMPPFYCNQPTSLQSYATCLSSPSHHSSHLCVPPLYPDTLPAFTSCCQRYACNLISESHLAPHFRHRIIQIPRFLLQLIRPRFVDIERVDGGISDSPCSALRRSNFCVRIVMHMYRIYGSHALSLSLADALGRSIPFPQQIPPLMCPHSSLC